MTASKFLYNQVILRTKQKMRKGQPEKLGEGAVCQRLFNTINSHQRPNPRIVSHLSLKGGRHWSNRGI